MEITVFTDGACTNNGKINAKAGFGVHFPNKELKDISKPFTLAPITNQRSELYAIYIALNGIFKRYPNIKKIHLYSDSMYSIRCITEWIHNWKKNNWKTSNRKPVKNVDIIKAIDNIVSKHPNIIKYHHVRSHTGNSDLISIGNDVADRLATSGIGN